MGRNYSFEKDVNKIRTTAQAKEEAEIFLERIHSKVGFDKLDPSDRTLITDYMKASVLNINWYDKEIKNKKRETWIYFIITFGLLLFVPVIFFLISTEGWLKGNSSFDIAGLVMAVLSGIIAFQKSFSQWFSVRIRKGQFWKASSAIKENLYKLQGSYRDGQAFDAKQQLTNEFEKAIIEATAQCSKIASDEQQAFFDQETLPDIDLISSLTGAKTAAASLVSAFRSDAAQAREEIANAERIVRQDKAAIVRLENRALEISNKLKDRSLSSKEKEDLKTELTAVKSELEKERIELVASETKLVKLKA